VSSTSLIPMGSWLGWQRARRNGAASADFNPAWHRGWLLWATAAGTATVPTPAGDRTGSFVAPAGK
jgi:hypothetical protein